MAEEKKAYETRSIKRLEATPSPTKGTDEAKKRALIRRKKAELRRLEEEARLLSRS